LVKITKASNQSLWNLGDPFVPDALGKKAIPVLGMA